MSGCVLPELKGFYVGIESILGAEGVPVYVIWVPSVYHMDTGAMGPSTSGGMKWEVEANQVKGEPGSRLRSLGSTPGPGFRI